MKQMLFLLFVSLGLSMSAQTKKVLLIGIDGCRPDALQIASTPNIDVLIANSTYSYDAMNTGITISGPGWGSLLTGSWPEKHLIIDNGFSGNDLATYPSLFQRLEEHDPNLNTVSICQWHPINDQINASAVDLAINVSDHTSFVEDAAVSQLNSGDPDVLFLHFDDVDHAGHGFGFSPEVSQYIAAIETVDSGIGGVVAAINARPTFADEDWMIILSTDHGGINTSHGGNTLEERRIFMVISNDEVSTQELAAEEIEVVHPPAVNCLNPTEELYFNGASSVVTSLNALYNFNSEQDFTIECRVRTENSGDVAIITDKDWDSGLNPGWVFSFNVNGGPWKINVGDGSNRVDLEGNEIADGEWHTLSATFDRDGMLSIYEDGVFIAATSMAGIGNIFSGFPITMGADAYDSYGYEGHLAEVRIFSGILPSATIEDWHCESIGITHPSENQLIGYWKLTDGAPSTTVNDSGPSSIHGQIQSAQWQDATDSETITELDFTATPKQVDYFYSAFEHLCVPISPDWNLDWTTVVETCPTDIDKNGQVDINDFLALNSAFGQLCECCREDINRDGEVGIDDFLDFNSEYGTTCD